MSAETVQDKPIQKPKADLPRDPSLQNRKAGQSRTILLYPLHNSIEEAEIEEFVKQAALSSPLRIDIFRFQSNDSDEEEDEDIDVIKDENDNDDAANYNAYAYCTFTSSTDCWLTKKHLNNHMLKDHKVSITFSTVPRTDLEGITNIIEFGTNYPPITHKWQVGNFLKSYPKNDTVDDDDFTLISNPRRIEPAPGHGAIKGKWFITYQTPEIATKALEFFSGRYYLDTENNKTRFVILNYQLHRNKHPLDRQECFYGITDRVIIRNVPPTIQDKDDIRLFLKSNGFDVHKDVLDINIVHQMASLAAKKYNAKKQKKNHKTFKQRNGFVVITFKTYELANKAYTNLNHKQLNDEFEITTGFTSPSMRDPLKRLLKGNTTVVHLSNLVWDVTEEQLREWLETAATRYLEKHKHMKKDDGKKKEKSENPFISTDANTSTKCTRPVSVFIKYRDWYSTGRANATFATSEEATMVVEMLNGRRLKGRKIMVNWALPINDYRFRETRNIALGRNNKRKDQKGKKQDKKSKKREFKRKWVNDVKKEQTHQTVSKSGNTNDTKNEKRGKKRRQKFKKPSTKKIKLTL
eukprot:103631_1